jgi:REP element-mobilizing transposase RayT
MSDTFSSLSYHLVFSTKERLPLLTRRIRSDVFFYIGGIVRGIGGVALAVGGMPDHVHLVVALPTSVAVADAVRTVKANSSKWINEQQATSRFGWQAGYGAFSVSQSLVPVVVQYAENQALHHRRRTFSEEFAALMKRHGV